MEQKIRERLLVESPEQAMTLLNPLRGEIIAHLMEPASAAEVARKLGESPQRINYHLKTLEKVGLVIRVGSRQVRNLVEILYQSVAKTFILADSLNVEQETIQKLKDQGALAHLISTADRIKKDALMLMEQSDKNQAIPNATLQFQVMLGNEEQRSEFLEEYVAAVKKLTAKYQAKASDEAEEYRVILVVYPYLEQGVE